MDQVSVCLLLVLMVRKHFNELVVNFEEILRKHKAVSEELMLRGAVEVVI